MFASAGHGLGRILIINCERGDNLMDMIHKALTEHRIESAVILSGIATFDKINYHYVANRDQIPKEYHVRETGAFEVSNISGCILHGEPHIHFTAHDLNQKRTISAHLEAETTVLYVAELVIAEILNLAAFTRVNYPDKVILS